MRLGFVGMTFGYTVDLDDPRQVERAKEAALEDFYNAAKYNEQASVQELDLNLRADSIPEFILRETTWFDNAKAQLLELWRGGLDYNDEDGLQETMNDLRDKHGLEDSEELYSYLDELIARKDAA